MDMPVLPQDFRDFLRLLNSKRIQMKQMLITAFSLLLFFSCFLCMGFPFALSAEDMIDPTAGQSGVCEVHNISMQKVRVPIAYGFPLPWSEEDKKYFDAKEKLFPHANPGKVEGGCIPSPQKEADIYVCPRCEKEREDWVRANRSQDRVSQQGAVAEGHAAELSR